MSQRTPARTGDVAMAGAPVESAPVESAPVATATAGAGNGSGRAQGRAPRWFDDILWGPETAQRLEWAYTALAALIGLRIVLGPYRRLAGTPDALFDPVAVLGWLDGMPPAAAIIGLQAIGGVAALAAVLRRRPRLAFAVAWVCYLVLAGLRGSRGKILHNDLLALWATAPFLLAPVGAAGARLRDSVARRAYGWPIRAAVVIVALVYFFAGFHKLQRSGIDWAVGDNVQFLLLWGPTVGDIPWGGLAQWVADNAWVSRATGVFFLSLELTFPIVLVLRRLQPLYALGAVALHAGTWLLLGLDYWGWAVTVLVLLIDWPAVVHRYRFHPRRLTRIAWVRLAMPQGESVSTRGSGPGPGPKTRPPAGVAGVRRHELRG